MPSPKSVLLLATPDVSASSLFGLYDTLAAAGRDWETFVTGDPEHPTFEVKIVGPSLEPFPCGSGTLIVPDLAFAGASGSDLVIVPGMNLSAREPLAASTQSSREWLWERHRSGSRVVAACSGAIYLAAIGLLDGIEATTHWVYGDLFRRHYPAVRLRLDRSLCFSDAASGVVTSGGTTAWQELALFLIANYGDVRRAANTAKFWLMADRGDMQKPFVSMVKANPHGDAAVGAAQIWLGEHYAVDNPVREATVHSGLPATTFARRFREATGLTPIAYVQTLRIEEAKQLLEATEASVASIGQDVGYEDTAYFRRLFKRKTGLTPAEHRKMFGDRRFARYS